MFSLLLMFKIKSKITWDHLKCTFHTVLTRRLLIIFQKSHFFSFKINCNMCNRCGFLTSNSSLLSNEYSRFFLAKRCESGVVLGSAISSRGFLQLSRPGGKSPSGESRPKTARKHKSRPLHTYRSRFRACRIQINV